MSRRVLIFILASIFIVACESNFKKNAAAQFSQDSLLVAGYINKGDSIYAQKANYSSFSKSSDLYDSAWQIAQQTADTNLMATAILAKGRAYDAMNSNPQKTIDYYSQAAALYATMPHKKIKALYLKHLVAHAYDKVQDSSNCVKILKELYNEILPMPDSIKIKMRFMVEMGLISTVVKNYTFADSIFHHLTKREWIANNPTEYDYLNHYLLAKAKISVLQHRQYNSPYIDSLENIFATSRNLSDSMFYSNELWELYKAMGNKTKESYFLNLNTDVFNKFNSPESVREAKDKMAKMEVAAVEASRKAENEKAENRKWFIYILSALLATITILAFFLQKRNIEVRRKNKEAALINQQLHQKNLQNELLNKEIHHRVKNNLQMIMSLVHMQENNTNTEEVKENMQSIRLRIESIAKLHQQLMEQSDVVDLKKYIQYIVSNAANLIADNKKTITHLDIETLQVPQKISFPLGLIINEWVTNSVKYAQPASGALEIAVHIFNESDNLKVHYKDNGKPQTERLPKKSLGLEIVGILTEQMDGNIETTESNPYQYKLTIPLTDGE